MRGMKYTMMTARHMALLVRRCTNHNAHVITPHGKVMAGRKGRTG